MARYRKIDPRIWNDAKFRDLSDRGKLAFLFALTHPHMTAIGSMRATESGLAEELGWPLEAFREAFGEALSKGMAKHDRRASLLVLPNFLKYNAPESPNVVKAWASSLDMLPECTLKDELIQLVKAFAEALPEAFSKALPEAFAKAFAKGMPYQEQEQEQEQERASAVTYPSLPVKDGATFDLTASLAKELRAAFPRTDLVAEMKLMRAWLIANPGRVKTAKGMPRFMHSWLSRAAKDPAPSTSGGMFDSPALMNRL